MNSPAHDELIMRENTGNEESGDSTNVIASDGWLTLTEAFECTNSLSLKFLSCKSFDDTKEEIGHTDSIHLLDVNSDSPNDPDTSVSKQYVTEQVSIENSHQTNSSSQVNLEPANEIPLQLKEDQCISEKELDSSKIDDCTTVPTSELEYPEVLEYRNVDWIYPSPKVIACADAEFRLSAKSPSDNYLRGCLWSPDGSCILTNSHDNVLRLFNLPSSVLSNDDAEPSSSEPEEMKSVLSMHEKELIYDYCWYPLMCSADPLTCCLASTSRRNPIRLWDAFSGIVRANYIPVNHLGEVVSASSISFSSNGLRLYAGFHRYIQVFDVCRPGTDSIRRPKLGRKPIQGGIISCIGVLNDRSRNIYATGSYNGTVCIFSEPGNLIARLFSHRTGVTQVTLTKTFAGENGAPWYVLAGGRMNSRLVVWDARNLVEPITIIHRRIENHQKFQFDVEPTGCYLFTGSQTGVVCAYDLPECIKQFCENGQTSYASSWRAHSDSTNGVSVHPSLPIVATSSGQRRVKQPTFKHKKCKIQRTMETSEVQHSLPNVNTPCNKSDSDSDSTSCDEKVLNDNEAAVMAPPVTGSTTSSETDGTTLVEEIQLALKGELTLIPRENRLNLWTFPLLEAT
ncbi:unnamed protein product [Heterobilharzia americana]|nr:unnamed protein product [Heterobilharzia americana]